VQLNSLLKSILIKNKKPRHYIMSLLNTILQAQGGAVVGQLAKQFGLNGQQANTVLQQLIPALSGGLKHNVNNGGLDALLGAIQNGNHDRYLNNLDDLANPSSMLDGNGILGHVFGNKEVSREVAGRASSNTGLDTGLLKKMLPIVATLAMSALNKQSGSSSSPLNALLGGTQSNKSGLESMLTAFLDADGDGSMVDDLLGKVLSGAGA